MTQKFEELHISITPINQEKSHYLVRTEESPKGVLPAEEQVVFPVEDWLDQASRLMDDSVAGLLKGYGLPELFEDDLVHSHHAATAPANSGGRSHPVVSSQDTGLMSPRSKTRSLVDLGREMYEALFQGTLGDRLTSAQAIAHNRGAVLRLRLGLKDSILPRLPWEVLHEDTRPIATGKDTIFSRYQPTLSSPILPPPPSGPVKVLMVIAAPTNQENLSLTQEANTLKEELKKRQVHGAAGNAPLPEIQLEILEHPDRETLTQVLEQNSYHVLHYAGHSNLGSKGGELYLVNQKTGLGEVLNGDDLAGLLVNNGINLAVFNSCRGTHNAKSTLAPDTNNPRNLAQVLVNRGIPAVLAMAERIPDRVALTLTRLFYHNLKQGYPVDLSLNRARQGLMSTYGSDRLYWALPVLYLHEKYQGYLTQQTMADTEAFMPEATLQNSQQKLVDVPRETNGHDPGFPWRNSHSDEVDDEDDFLHPGDRKLPEDYDDFIDDGLAEDDSEFLDYEMGDDGDSDAESLVSDIFSELGFGKPGSGDVPDSDTGTISPSSDLQADFPDGDRENRPTQSTEPSTKTAQNPAPSSESSQSSPKMLVPPTKTHKRSKWRLGLVSVVSIALLAGGVQFWRSRPETRTSLSTNTPTEEVVTASEGPAAKVNPWETASTPEVAAIAIENFVQGKLAEGTIAVHAMLDRGALQQAKATLEAVPNSKRNTAEINFVYGRLAWQFVQIGNPDYSVNDARRFWEASVKSDSGSPLYANALAFAYYAEGNLELASEMWLRVVTLLEPTQSLDNPEALTAYAGLGLIMMKSSTNAAEEQQPGLISKAVKQRKMVMKLAPTNFQPDALAKNWMWPEFAIADWQQLLELEN